jgi:TetR/AcrR family transcriptional repressor of nem operon
MAGDAVTGERPAKGERTRRRIVGHATELIYSKGYSKTTIDDVIKAAGVTKGSFYFHFSSKEELGEAVIENAASFIHDRFAKVLQREDLPPRERLKAMLGQMKNLVEAAGCSRGCIIGNLALETSRSHPAFRRKIAEVFRSWSALIAFELEKMKKAGDLPPDFDSRAYADFTLAALEGGIMLSKVTQDPGPMRNCMDTVIRQLDEISGRWTTKGSTEGEGSKTEA